MTVYTYNYGAESRTAGYMPVYGQEKPRTSGASAGDTAAPIPAHSAAASDSAGPSSFYNFCKGVFDVVNPLQHIPVVGAVYRRVTGDEPAPMARLAGDGLYGGPVGALVGFADIALKKTTGKDMGERAFALLDTGTRASGTQFASNVTNSGGSSLPVETARNEPATTPASMPVLASKDGGARMAASAPLLQHSAPEGKAATPAPSGPTVSAPSYTSTAEPSGPMLSAPQTVQQYFVAHGTEGPATVALDPPVVSKDMIAAKMMEALDKYGEMKKTGLSPVASTVSGVY